RSPPGVLLSPLARPDGAVGIGVAGRARVDPGCGAPPLGVRRNPPRLDPAAHVVANARLRGVARPVADDQGRRDAAAEATGRAECVIGFISSAWRRWHTPRPPRPSGSMSSGR